MLPIGMLAVWAAYAVGSWGFVLVKGYDVTFRNWVSPLNPWSGTWPPPKIPVGQLWPKGTSAVTTDQPQTPDNPGGQA